jgi:glycine/D-amino acid oxidase-like deaminating enzyme/nitrite reductase/ring-hydroxylating ferredoxin subunit
MTSAPFSLPPLGRNETADVCVVGAGIAGLTTAYLLARAGTSVIVLERADVGAGMTGRTTAHLANALDDRYYELEELHGADGARLAAESHTAAIDEIEGIVRSEGIECGFERLDGYLFVPPGGSVESLTRELDAVHRAGLRSVEKVVRAPVARFDTGTCLRFPRQGQFHPLLYLNGLVQAIVGRGGRLYRAHVKDISSGDDPHVETDCGMRVSARSIVVCTNSPIKVATTVHNKQAPYTTYVIGARIPRGTVATMLLWDTAQDPQAEEQSGPAPYHYVRVEKRGAYDTLIVGGEDHRTGEANDGDARFSRLEDWARQRFPMILQIDYRWSGQVLEPVDGLAFIGADDEPGVYIATGDSGNGMTHGTIAGMLLCDLIRGQENRWADLYDPMRKKMGALGTLAKRTANAISHFKEYVTGGDFDSEDQIPRGSGGIVRHGLSKLAIYVDENGTRHRMSAVCPHMKCIVQWNQTERTWDCPCHGSRFDCTGEVITAPTTGNLEPASPEEVPTSGARSDPAAAEE